MKRFTTLTLATALVSGLAVSQAAAQSGADTTGENMGNVTYGEFIANLRSGALADVDLMGVTKTSDVEIVRLSEVGESDLGTLIDAVALEAVEFQRVSEQIAANDYLKGQLQEEGFMPADVIAVDAFEEGEVRFFVDDRS